MKFLSNFKKPLNSKTRRILSRIKTIAIIALTTAVIGEYVLRQQTELMYKERISEYKTIMYDIKEELILVRNSVPVDIEKMGQLTNTIIAIQNLAPEIELPAAEYFAGLIVHEASKYESINPNMIVALMKKESSYDPLAVSLVGARGLGQVMPSTGRWIVEDKWGLPYNDSLLFDPVQNTKITAWYLNYLMTINNNNFKIALAYYNGGHYQAKRYKLLLEQKAGKQLSAEEVIQLDKLPAETTDYVPKVNGFYKQIKGLRAKTIKATKE